MGNEGSVFVRWDTAELLVPVVFTAAFFVGAREELVIGFVAAGFFVHPRNDAFLNGLLDWIAEQMPRGVFWVLANFPDDLIEQRAWAAVGRHDGERASPLGYGLGDFVQGALIWMEGELVEFDVPAFAREGVRVGGQTMDAAAVCELQNVGGIVLFVVEEDAPKPGGGDVEQPGPLFAVFEVEGGLELVAGADPNIELGLGVTGFKD